MAGMLVSLMRSLGLVGMTMRDLPWNSILQWFSLGRAVPRHKDDKGLGQWILAVTLSGTGVGRFSE